MKLSIRIPWDLSMCSEHIGRVLATVRNFWVTYKAMEVWSSLEKKKKIAIYLVLTLMSLP